MLLHKYNEEFRELITIVAYNKNLPESAVARDLSRIISPRNY